MIEYLTTHRAKLVERAVAASLCRGAQCVASGTAARRHSAVATTPSAVGLPQHAWTPDSAKQRFERIEVREFTIITLKH